MEKGVVCEVVTDVKTTHRTAGEHDGIDPLQKQYRNVQISNNERVNVVQVNDIHTEENVVGTSEECMADSSKIPWRRVGIDISLEELKEVSSMKRKDAAKYLNVSVSTLKRVCRHYHIPRWPPRKRNIDHLSRSGDIESTKEIEAPTKQNDSLVTIKAKYGDNFIRFQLFASSGIDIFSQQVSKRLKLDVGNYIVKYQDDVNDWILVACDQDLKDYISRSISLGKTTLIILIERI